MEGARSSLLKVKFVGEARWPLSVGAGHFPCNGRPGPGVRESRKGWNMASSDQHLAAGGSASRGPRLRGSPPPVPVVLRIPRIVEEAELPPEPLRVAVPRRRAEFRWRVGVGVGALMLVTAIPWLIRWPPPADGALEALAPPVAMETDSDSEILPPLYAQTASNSSAFVPSFEPGNENGSELVEGLTVPHPPGGPQ